MCTRLGISHLGVARKFSHSFNGQEETIYGLKLRELAESIDEYFNLPREGEKWFKGKVITGGDLNSFLKDGHKDPNCAKGIPSSYLKN